jgi:serine/threonine-protein kinase
MLPSRLELIEELFHSTLERGAAYLDSACGDDMALRSEVAALVESYREWTAELPPAPEPAMPRFGAYQCDRILGLGGMGMVYAAHRVDGQFAQNVAIKVLRSALRSDLHRKHFLDERQTLARLNHPSIARLLDGGTTDEGEPFLVMELIEGETVESYSRRKQLAAPDCAALVEHVLDAVDYAHRSLVVHRDLKPGNILVTASGEVKLLDFGTSKLVDDDPTVTSLRAITPQYASPEQIRGEPVGVASDVFSAGAVLYELVENAKPFGDDFAGRFRRQYSIKFPKPLDADLETILTKALADEPERRYLSAAHFAEDLRRYRSGEPVLARPQTWRYRTGKFVRRNAVPLAVAFVLLAAAASAGVYALVAQSAALREANRALQLNLFVTDMFGVINPARREPMKVAELLSFAGDNMDRNSVHDDAVLSDMHRLLAIGYNSGGDYAKSKELTLLELAEAKRSGDPGRYAVSLCDYGLTLYNLGEKDVLTPVNESLRILAAEGSSFAHWQSASVNYCAGTVKLYVTPADHSHIALLEEAERLGREYPYEGRFQFDNTLVNLAESYVTVKRYRDAEALLEEAAAIERKKAALRIRLPATLHSLGRVNRFLGRLEEDERYHKEAYEVSQQENGAAVQDFYRAVWAYALANTGKCAQAVREADAALTDMRKMSPNGGFQLWSHLATAAYSHICNGDFAEAEAFAREALEALRSYGVLSNDARSFETRGYVGLSLAGQRRYKEAVPWIEPAVNYFGNERRVFPFRDRLIAALAESRKALGITR